MKKCTAILVAGVLLLAGVGNAAVMDKAIWLFDGDATDSVNGYHGAAAGGGVTYVDDHPNPVGGSGYDYVGNKCLKLDASATAYVRVANTDSWLTAGSGGLNLDLLVEFWMKTSSNSADMRMIYFSQTTGHSAQNYQLTMASGIVKILSWDGNWDSVSSTGTVNDGEWHHIAYTNDGSNNTIYIDGVFNNSAAAGRIQSNYGAGYPFDFGKQSGGVPSYNGLLDEVRVTGVTQGEAFPDPMSLYLNSFVPEPLTLGLVAVGGLFAIKRRR